MRPFYLSAIFLIALIGLFGCPPVALAQATPRLEPAGCGLVSPASDCASLKAAAVKAAPIVVLALLPVLAAVAGWAGWRALTYRRLPHTLRTSRRLIAWQPAVIGAALAALLVLLGNRDGEGPFTPFRIVESLVPLIAGMQAAYVFSPEDEPGLEVLLACPRPLAWTVIERLVLLLAWQGLAALLGGLAASALLGTPVLEGIARWLPPLVLFSAIALCITLATRTPVFSVALTLLLWFGMLMSGGSGGGGLLARWPYLWPMHIYLQPDHSYYWLNRASLLLLGLNLAVLAAVHLLRDEERVLLGARAVARSRAQRKGEAA